MTNEKEDVKTWEETFSVEFRKCPYCGANWCREFVDNIFVRFCPACGNRVFNSKMVINLYDAVDKVREETAKVEPLQPHLRSIDAFTEFMCDLPPYAPSSEEEWDEGMKRAEEFHRALNKEEL